MKKFLMALLFAPLTVLASGGAHLDHWPGAVGDKAALQNGAWTSRRSMALWLLSTVPPHRCGS